MSLKNYNDALEGLRGSSIACRPVVPASHGLPPLTVVLVAVTFSEYEDMTELCGLSTLGGGRTGSEADRLSRWPAFLTTNAAEYNSRGADSKGGPVLSGVLLAVTDWHRRVWLHLSDVGCIVKAHERSRSVTPGENSNSGEGSGDHREKTVACIFSISHEVLSWKGFFSALFAPDAGEAYTFTLPDESKEAIAATIDCRRLCFSASLYPVSDDSSRAFFLAWLSGRLACALTHTQVRLHESQRFCASFESTNAQLRRRLELLQSGEGGNSSDKSDTANNASAQPQPHLTGTRVAENDATARRPNNLVNPQARGPQKRSRGMKLQ